MGREEANGGEGLALSLGLTRLRVDAEAVVNAAGVKFTTPKIRPADNGADSRSTRRSNLPAWLTASKAALAASQAEHLETQRRISKLQEETKGLSIIDFPEHNGTEDSQTSASGRVEGNAGGVAGGEGPAKDEKPRGNLHQLHRMPLVVIAEVVSFLETQAVLRYALACKMAEGVLWQDECWGGIFRMRHLNAAVGTAMLPPSLAAPARQMPSASSQRNLELGNNIAASKDSDDDAPTQTGVLRARTDAPLRTAVIAHARCHSRALCLFDVAVSDGGKTKAVVNGPARTAAAVASLRALVEITANVSDPVGRRAFSDIRTGQMLLSIITREHGSAVLQDLACAVLGNLLCDPEAAAGEETARRTAELNLLDGSSADKLLGRSKRSAIQALTALCSSARPSLSSWSAPQSGGGGMRPVENLPGRQASRALINLLLPRYQVSQQLEAMPNKDSNRSRQPAVRSSSLPLMASPARQERPQKLQGRASESFPQASIPARAKAAKGGRGVGGAQPAPMAWEENNEVGEGSVHGAGGGRGGRRGGGAGGRATDGRTSFPQVTASAASGQLVQLLSEGSTGKNEVAATTTATPSVHNTATPSPTRSSPRETQGVSPIRAEPSAAAAMDRNPQPMFPLEHTPPCSGSIKSVPTPPAPLGERTIHCGGGCNPREREKAKLLDSPSATCVNQRGLQVCSEGGSRQVEEIWEAFYFYHGGGVKDTFLATLSFVSTFGGGIFGRGTDKLGNFFMEGAPLLGHTARDTWFITKTYTGRGVSDAASSGGDWSGGAHVTHTAYLARGLANDHRPLEEDVALSSMDMPIISHKARRIGFWGVWEPVLGRAGGCGAGGGGARRAGFAKGASVVPDGSTTTLSRRGGVFRWVPKQQEE